MNSKLLHTPVGVRDIYGTEYEQKLLVMDRIHDIFKSYGYSDIQTPTFEFFDIFNKERGSVASKNMYKFFDREGNTLVLRPDMTPSIARAAAKYYMDEQFPMRFCYSGNAFINDSEYQGKLKEFTQVGAELLGDTTSDADAEVIVMVIESLIAAGLTEFQIEVGHPEYFKGIVEELNLEEEIVENLTDILENKKYFGIDTLVEEANIPENYKEIFLKFQEFDGNVEILDKALELANNEKSREAIQRLKKLDQILQIYGMEKYVSYDLSMLNMYKYYTGVVFRGYTYGTGDAIATGGRYDNLLKQFGKDFPAIGFAVNVDRLMVAMSRQHLNEKTKEERIMILYKEENREKAINYSNELRAVGVKVMLVRKRSVYDIEEYYDFARRSNIHTVVEVTDEITKKRLD
ncbi:MAG: ATP phosphoribosyltransferase regulatory subunit [Lachnospiraceae bacterium]|nr:ATP phosphoribosyltransferase regulatory subunit [Lachnospiraceae bacterium]